MLVGAWAADFELMLGNVEAAARWAETSGLSVDEPPVFWREDRHFAYARVLLAQKRPDQARRVLAHLERYARRTGLMRSLISVYVLQAASSLALGDRNQALASLEEAVHLAAPEGYRRVFLDEGPAILALLPAVHRAAPQFVDSLLGESTPDHDRRAVPIQPIVEPLSERELEVLRLMADGLSNQEIAGKLFITVGTVKTHVHHICGKLAVASRVQAAARARELGLL
jgi:LuxR family maltose regulon positive regulatory protein